MQAQMFIKRCLTQIEAKQFEILTVTNIFNLTL